MWADHAQLIGPSPTSRETGLRPRIVAAAAGRGRERLLGRNEVQTILEAISRWKPASPGAWGRMAFGRWIETSDSAVAGAAGGLQILVPSVGGGVMRPEDYLNYVRPD